MLSPQMWGAVMLVQKNAPVRKHHHNEMMLPIATEIDTNVCFQQTSIYAD
jgi:hypothetical protein